MPIEVKNLLPIIGNKTAKKNLLKIYSTLVIQSKRSNSSGYFDVPSTFLHAINSHYNNYINCLVENNIVKYYTTEHQDPNDLFKTINKKFYSTNNKVCMKYKFLIDITQGEEVEIDLKSNRKEKWYSIVEYSLNLLGYDIDIKRDSFGRRVHHPAIMSYKEDMKGKGMAMIDSVCSQPRLLYLMMKERSIVDVKYNFIFENNMDFYTYLIENLNEEDRQTSKDLFMYWLNANGYVPNYDIHKVFPEASKFLKRLKNNNYKTAASTMQREEARIWIDDLLSNIPVSFCLPVHDCLIVKQKEVRKVLEYCKLKHPELEYKITYL